MIGTTHTSHPLVGGLRAVVRHVPGAWTVYTAARRTLWELRAAFHGLRTGPLVRLQSLVRRRGPVQQAPSRFAPVPPDAIERPTSVPLTQAPRAAQTAYLLAREGAGPKLYDWRPDPQNHATFVVGAQPAYAGDRLAELATAGRIVPVTGAPLDAPAFERFRIADPRAEMAALLDTDHLHFGREHVLRGRRYLYQSIPSLGRSGRRDTERRWRLIADRLEAADRGVEGRLVLDVGCNAGMMLACALGDGAAFGVGWDRPAIAPLAEGILGNLGFTRHHIVGAELDSDYRLTEDVPTFAAPLLDGCTVLYLAIRHHVGFVADLADIPWRSLVYEGGEEESAAELEETLRPLRERCRFTIADRLDYRDGEGQARPLAILVRD